MKVLFDQWLRRIDSVGLSNRKAWLLFWPILPLALLPHTALAAEAATLADRIAQVGAGTATFYASFLSALLLLSFVAYSAGERLWAAFLLAIAIYGCWFFLMEQLAYDIFFINEERDAQIISFSGHILHAALFLMGAAAIPPSHRLSWVRPAYRSAAIVTLCVGVIGLMGSREFAFALFNVSSLIVGSSAILPFFVLERLGSETTRPVIIYSLLFWLPVGVFYVWLLFLTEENIVLLHIFNRLVIGCVAAFGGYTTVRRIFALREERENALRDALAVAQKEAQTNRALYAAERKYADARQAIVRQSDLLSEVSHDIKQPIASLRTNVEALTISHAPEVREQLRAAFDYLEALAVTYKSGTFGSPVQNGEVKNGPSIEDIPVAIIVDTLDRMFRSEAEAKGLSFNVKRADVAVTGDPVVIMRILSNLLSNAIRHSVGGEIALTVLDRSPDVRFEVFNSAGQTDSDLASAFYADHEEGQKGEGSGLGLGIVRKLARDNEMALTLHTDTLNGNTFSLVLRAASVRSGPVPF